MNYRRIPRINDFNQNLIGFHVRRFAVEHVDRLDAVLDHANGSIENAHQVTAGINVTNSYPTSNNEVYAF